MFNATSSPFSITTSIPSDTQCVFVSDLFVEDYVGGAELTTEALITSSPLNVFRLHSRDVSMQLLKAGKELFWIFGNFAQLNAALIPSIVANLRYAVIEFDFKYCRERSPPKHKAIHDTICDCHDSASGKLVS